MWLKECSTYLSVSDVFAVVFDVILGHVVELLLLPGPTVPHCQHIIASLNSMAQPQPRRDSATSEAQVFTSGAQFNIRSLA